MRVEKLEADWAWGRRVKRVVVSVWIVTVVGLSVLPTLTMSRSMDRHHEAMLELRTRTAEMQFASEELIRRQNDLIGAAAEQQKINELHLRLFGTGFKQTGDLATRVDQLERASNIPPQALPVTPREP